MTFKDELAGLCDPVQGPWLPTYGEDRRARGNPAIATRGELLGDSGFRRPEILRESIAWWQGVMRECDISLVIADNAPCALLAVPQHREQQYNAAAVERHGALISVDKETGDAERFRSIILDAYENASMARRARDLADDLRPHFHANLRKLIRRKIAAVMDHRI